VLSAHPLESLFSMKPHLRLNASTLALWAALIAGVLPAHAQVTVQEAWVRGTVGQQKASGMFAQIRSAQPARLVSAASPVAGVVEIHEMAMEGNVMRMRAISGLELPAGKLVELKPGGYHVMLMQLKQPLEPGSTVPVTLVVESGGKRESIEVKASVRTRAGQPAAGGHKH
jgi:copper(I)-binding protein